MTPEEEKHPDNQKLEHEGWTDFKEKRRNCTDKLCVLLIIASWIATTIVGFIVTGIITDDSIPAGNPVRLTHATDYKGDICGFHDGVKSRDKAYYLPDLSVVCQSSCPSESNYEAFICRDRYQDQANADLSVGYSLVADSQCMYVIKTKEFVNRCLPDINVLDAFDSAQDVALSVGVNLTSNSIYDTASDANDKWFNNFAGDMLTLRPYIFGFGIGISTFVAFLYLFILRLPGFLLTFIWVGILSVLGFIIVGSILLLSLASTWANDDVHSDVEVLTMRVIAYIGFGLAGLYACLVLVLRKRLQLAIAVVKQASKAFSTIPSLLAVPVIQVIGLCCFLTPWLIYMFYLASSGQVETKQGFEIDFGGFNSTYTYRTFSFSPNTQYAFLYLVFSFFWTTEFIVAIGQLVIALGFTAWYFSRDKSNLNSFTLHWAFRIAIFCHMGTVAYGSLIIAVIKTIRTILNYLRKKAEKTGNILLQYIFCCLQCCLCCIEKIMKFINKHAYILTAIYGYPFCKAARKGFFLLLRNILRVAAVNLLSTFLIFLGKLFIASCTTFLCYLVIAYNFDDFEITGLVAPLIFVFLISYWIGAMFMEIFGMGIETILFCFIADEEMFEPADRYATGDLMSTMQKTALRIEKRKKYKEAKKIGKKRNNKNEVEMSNAVVNVNDNANF